MKFTNKESNERFESLLLSKKILEKFKIKYFLEGGVFLGLIRDKDFISWDNDIELAVFSEDIFGKEYMIANELVKNGFDILMGARPMSRLIQDKIKKSLADEILFGKLSNGGSVSVDLNNEGEIKLNFIEELASV